MLNSDLATFIERDHQALDAIVKARSRVEKEAVLVTGRFSAIVIFAKWRLPP